MPTLLVHRDVDAHLEELDVSLRESIRQKVIWAETQLAMTGRALRVKGTHGQAWRRTPVRGNEYYLWWAPADAVGAGSPELGPAVALRDLRHHDRLVPPTPAAPEDYRVVHPRELDPRSALQARVARDAPPSGVASTVVRGQPGTGKTLTLLYAARDLAASRRVLYITYTPRLAAEALLFARANGIEAQMDVVTLSALEAAILREAPEARAEDPALLAQRFEGVVRSIDSSVIGAWSGKGHALWAEARACLVGMALPFAWRRGPLAIPPCEMLDREIYRKVSGLDQDAAERAHHMADIARRRGLLADQTTARAALDALVQGDSGRLDLGGTSAVLVDEVQDLTPVEIALLLEVVRAIARRSRAALFVAAGDDSQTVHPSGFAWGLAKDLIHARLGREPADVVLGHAMRNPGAVLSVVQKTGALYKLLAKELRPSGGAAAEASEIEGAGRVLWCEPPDDAGWAALQGALVSTPGRALVTLGASWAGLGAGAAAAEVTFTPAEIKGLERRTVLVTGLDEALAALGRLTTRAEEQGRFLEGLEARHLVDGIRVALSRATETLVLLGPAPSSPLAARLDLARHVDSITWADLLRTLEEDDLTEAERARGFLDEAREHAARGDVERALERLGHAEALARGLSDPALGDAARALHERLDARARPSLVVAPAGGEFTSLTEAIGAAPRGARLLVRPGTYDGPFVIDKDLEIVGEGERASIVLQSDVVAVSVDGGRVALENLTIVRQKSGKLIAAAGAGFLNRALRRVGRALGFSKVEGFSALLESVSQAGMAGTAVAAERCELHLRGCDVDPKGGAALTVTSEARVAVEGCTLRNAMVGAFAAAGGSVTVVRSELVETMMGVAAGPDSRVVVRESSIRGTERQAILVNAGADGVLESNDISATKGHAIQVAGGATVVVRGNRIHHGESAAVRIDAGGAGIFEENDIEDSGVGFWVGALADPTVRHNRIRGCVKASGIFVDPKGRGTYEDNRISGSSACGVDVCEDAEVIVRRSTITDNGSAGIMVHSGGRGTFEDNEIFSHERLGVFVKDGAAPVVRNNRIHGGRDFGIVVQFGAGTIADNEIFKNRGVGIRTESMEVVVTGNRIHDNGGGGVFVQPDTMGLFERNEIAANKNWGFMVAVRGNPTVRGNRVHGSPLGIVASKGARGTYIGNDVRGNTRLGLLLDPGSSPVQCEGNVSDTTPEAVRGRGPDGSRRGRRR